MISYIKGNIRSISDQQIFIISDVLQIGFTIGVVQSSCFSIDKEVELYLYMHWNQEQGPSLYGFPTIKERELFALINSCSGIGPKMALTMLGQIDAALFISAIQSHDIKALSQLKGIGAKKAEQLILQLKDKVDGFVSVHKIQAVGAARHLIQIGDVLQSLNYSRPEIQQTIAYLRDRQYESEPSFDRVMRSALSFLSKKM